METNIILASVACYVIGSLPFAYFITKFFGFGDIRKIGSGNIGATNVLRTGNKKLAAIVLCLDIAKGFFPYFILNNFYILNLSEFTTFAISSLAIIGHIFPIWLKFKGGKGVATYIGFIFSINYLLGIIFIVIWLLIAIISRYSSLSSILSLFSLPFLILIFFNYNINIKALFFGISLLIIIKHYSNILRLFNKSETKIGF